ncbi:nucleoside hydrolase [Lactobacillus selangorensis]|nr:nucleoside hydrolase [Lactobacillus selangorensis]
MPEAILLDIDPGIAGNAALSIAINDPGVKLKLVTTEADGPKITPTTRHVLNIMQLYHVRIPVAQGAVRPLHKPFEPDERIHGEFGLDDYIFPEYRVAPLSEPAVAAAYQTLQHSKQPLTIVALGAYTNIAQLLTSHPDIKPKIKRIIAFGGSLHGGNMTSAAEFNVYSDPTAAQILYHAGVSIVMVGLDVSRQALLTTETMQKLGTLGPIGQMFQDLFTSYYNMNLNGIPVFDINALAYLCHPEFYQTRSYWIDVQTNGPAAGTTVADIRDAYHQGQVNAAVCETVDAAAFNQWFLSEITQMQSRLS